jgi:hypothetical protein
LKSKEFQRNGKQNGAAMRIGLEDQWLSLERIESDAYGVHVSVRVSSDGFTGHINVWFDSQAVTEFIAKLKRLEVTRSGAAEIKAMSPEKCSLELFTIDRWGHLAINASLGRHAFIDQVSRTDLCRVTFEIDAGRFQELIDDLSAEITSELESS